jgi:hypothetical protein
MYNNRSFAGQADKRDVWATARSLDRRFGASSGGRGGVEKLLGRKSVTPNQGQDIVSMCPIARVDNDVEPDAAKGGIRAEAVDTYMQDVDVLCGENSGQLMKKAGLVIEPCSERQVATG